MVGAIEKLYIEWTRVVNFIKLGGGHRRRIELEDKAKVVASDWGTESLPR